MPKRNRQSQPTTTLKTYKNVVIDVDVDLVIDLVIYLVIDVDVDVDADIDIDIDVDVRRRHQGRRELNRTTEQEPLEKIRPREGQGRWRRPTRSLLHGVSD